ncbi:hypothetical protein, partial [Rhodoblastus sp.]|uniref:hypothetical protein n=1 Tax=Rhodoblastus sp. TaxID=1962975 RepID=UPI003F984F2E
MNDRFLKKARIASSNGEFPVVADSVEKLSGSATSLRFGDVFKIGGLTPCRMAAATSPRYRRP